MKGCDNVCAFCVVPHTRGREVSRAFAEVLGEVADLTKVGVREVTLIGQNVNSYRGGISFAQLLLRTAEVPGIERVRFTTSHPHDLSDELIEAFRVQPKIAPHFHLPVQSGSDPVLKRMRRDYTVVEYLERLEKLRAARPDIAVTTDIIVGFPGETEEDFERTLELTEQVRYENQFSFIYSPRPKTERGAEGGRVGLGAARGEDRAAGAAAEAAAAHQRRADGGGGGQARSRCWWRAPRATTREALRPDAGEPHGELRRRCAGGGLREGAGGEATPNQLSGKQTVLLSAPVVVVPPPESARPELPLEVA